MSRLKRFEKFARQASFLYPLLGYLRDCLLFVNSAELIC